VDNNNKVELLGYYGGDKRSCLSAWQSTTSELGIDISNVEDKVDIIFDHLAKTKKKSPYDLLDFLAKHNHATPFEKSLVDFQLTGDIASHIHSLKHRISHINTESARYKELDDKYYLPFDWDIPIEDEYVADLTKSKTWKGALRNQTIQNNMLYHAASRELTKHLGRKRAKETARYFLMYNKQLNYDWQLNFRSFVNMQRLRNDDHSQKEIHYIANTMLYLVENIPGEPFKGCLEAFNLKSDPNYIL